MKYEQVTTVLTAGGNYNAPEAVDEINELIDLASKSHLQMMVGNGLRLDNLETFLKQVQSIDYLHFGSGVRIDENSVNPFSEEKIKEIKNIISKF